MARRRPLPMWSRRERSPLGGRHHLRRPGRLRLPRAGVQRRHDAVCAVSGAGTGGRRHVRHGEGVHQAAGGGMRIL